MNVYEQDKQNADAALKGRTVAVRDVVDEINNGRTLTLRVRSRDKDFVRCESEQPLAQDHLAVGAAIEVAGTLKARGLQGNITLADCVITAYQADDLPAPETPATVSPALPVTAPSASIGQGDFTDSSAHSAIAEATIVSVAELMAAYEKDKAGSDRQFKNVRFRVRDSIRDIENTGLVLGLPGKGQDVVKCPLAPAAIQVWTHLAPGMVVTIEGFGKGRGVLGNVTLDGCQVTDGPRAAANRATPPLGPPASSSPRNTESDVLVAIVSTLVFCLVALAANRFLRRRCPKCKSTKYALRSHDEIDRWVGTKTISNTSTAEHRSRTDQGSFQHTGTTTTISQQRIPVIKVACQDVFECSICGEKWDEISTRELS